MAKFVSKNSNLMIVLRPGIPGSTITGQQPKAGLYVRFQSGTVDIKEESVAEMLRAHPDFNTGFIEVKSEDLDPYEHTRNEVEPAHILKDMKYGQAEKMVGSAKKVKLSPELKKLIENEAVKMLPGLLKSNPKILKDILTNLASEVSKSETSDDSPEPAKRGPGRPPKQETTDKDSDETKSEVE